MAIRTTPQLGTIRANGQSQKFYGIYRLQDFSDFHSDFLKSTATAPRFVDGTLCCLQDGWRCTTFAVSGDEMSARVKLGWTTISLDINILYILVFMTKMNNWNKFIIKLTKNLSNMWGKCDEGIFPDSYVDWPLKLCMPEAKEAEVCTQFAGSNGEAAMAWTFTKNVKETTMGWKKHPWLWFYYQKHHALFGNCVILDRLRAYWSLQTRARKKTERHGAP